MESFNSTVATFLNPQGPDARPLPRVSFGAVNRAGTFKYLKTFGNDSQPGSNADPSDDVDALWTISSSTKFITTIAALQCVDKGLLTLDGDIGDVLPEWKNPNILTGFTETDEPVFVPAKNTVTLRGMAYAFESETLQKYQELRGPQPHPTTVKEAYELFLVEEPGTKWMYSPGMDWAGLMVRIHRARDQPLPGHLHATPHLHPPLPPPLLHPLPPRPPPLPPPPRTPATFRRDPANPSLLVPIPDPSAPTTDDFGGGGLVATAPALLAIYAAILHDADDDDDDNNNNEQPPLLLTRATAAEIFTPQLDAASRRGLRSIETVDPGALCGVPRGSPIQYGLGGLLNVEDVVVLIPSGDGGRGQRRGRKEGSLAWSGMRNFYFWIDRRAGVAGLQAMHHLPCGDERTVGLLGAFEGAVYEAVEAVAGGAEGEGGGVR
ncbi:beta-lactamase [Diplodia corticola]|uniref:Beta-lactamase n=1 Tax=Diplodia corticola TaxID=236234 RepID=A0A1J9RBA3_9PEZI|nr:beta-lactamase [Diplodia corticola]OJD37426.1 beta-lactamase [Diplodia corticola]